MSESSEEGSFMESSSDEEITLLPNQRDFHDVNLKKQKRRRKSTAASKEKVDREFGQFEKFTKGFGLKMLKKMGYQPGKGLGAKGQGIVNPVDVKARPKQMGMGFKGFVEREDGAESDIESDKESKTDNQNVTQKRWKKGPSAKPIITVESVTQPVVMGKIIDMTGSDGPREVSSMYNIFSTETSLSQKFSLVPELRHNLSLLVSNVQARLDEIDKELSRSKSRISSSESHVLGMENSMSALKNTILQGNSVKTLMERCEDISISQPASLASFSAVMIDLFNEHWDAFIGFELESWLISLIAKAWKMIVRGWDPFETATLEVDVFMSWINSGWFKVNPESSSSSERSMTPYETLFHAVWLPCVRMAFSDEDWRFDLDSHLAIKFLKIWKPVVPDYVFHQEVLCHLLLPKLEDEIQGWNPRVDDPDSIPLDIWFAEWTSSDLFDASQLIGLYDHIRCQLQLLYEESDPVDDHINEAIISWSKVLPANEYLKFLEKSIVPKLVNAFKDRLIVDPSDQDMDVYDGVVKWRNIIGSNLMAGVFQESFFPKWHFALYQWMQSDGVDFDEVVQWMEAWKKIIPFREESSIMANELKRGLNMMNQLIVNPSIPFDSFYGVVEMTSTPVYQISSKRKAEVVVTFKEIVEKTAAEHQLTFISTGKGHPINGKLLYRLGEKTLVWLDGQVAFIYKDGTDIPMALDDLIKLAGVK